MKKSRSLYTMLTLFVLNLMLHDTGVTGDTGMTAEMKTLYSDYLIDYAKPYLVHDQFGQEKNIPKNHGKKIEFRKKSPFAKALTPLVEMVVPTGNTLAWTTIDVEVSQYGSFVPLSDRVINETLDDNVVYATENCGDQAGRTLDTVTREVLNGGTNVQFANAQVAARYLLVGGDATAANNHYMSSDVVQRAVRNLKIGGAKPINGSFVCITHTDTLYDLMHDSKWIDVKSYTDPTGIYEGEVGKIWGVRFVETLEAKVFHAADLVAVGSTNANRNLTCASVSSHTFTMAEALATGEVTALVGRKVIVKGVKYTIASGAAGSAGTATLTVTETVTGTPTTDKMYPGEAGEAGRDVYSSLFLGADAYGTTKVTSEGLQHFIKQLGSAGTGDPIDQKATVGWKATKAAIRLVESYLLRVETASTFEAGAN